jgi:hypothetical protein
MEGGPVTATPDTLIEALWRFVRGDVPGTEFESWVYRETRLESELGGNLYLAAISTDFSKKGEVWGLRCALAPHARARSPSDCACLRLRDIDVVDMGTFQAPEPAFEADREWSDDDVLRTFERVKDRGSPRWWLWAARCRACGQGWLVGTEERQNDVYCLKRLDGGELGGIVDADRWPPDFDSYESLLRVGLQAGRSVHVLDPTYSSVRDTMADLARTRPGIAISELAKLLSIDLATAAELARKVAEVHGVQFTFDTDAG